MNGKTVKLNSSSICAEEEVGFFCRCAEFAVFMSFVSNGMVSDDFTKDWKKNDQGATIHICVETIQKCISFTSIYNPLLGCCVL